MNAGRNVPWHASLVNGIALLGAVCCAIVGPMGTVAGVLSFFADEPGAGTGQRIASIALSLLMTAVGLGYLIVGNRLRRRGKAEAFRGGRAREGAAPAADGTDPAGESDGREGKQRSRRR